jgi:hypothetical protein
MKKSLVFSLALGAGLTLACAASSALDGSIFGVRQPAIAARAQPAGQENAGEAPGCRRVEEALDEGYGVSRRVTRLVCEEKN